MPDFSTLQQQLMALEEKLKERDSSREEGVRSRQTALSELQESLEEKTNALISKIEELKRKETIVLTLRKVEPEIHEQFPKNYYIQVVYEDAVLSGNQKFTDFDENIIDEKFVLPLLFSTIVKVEVWTAEEDPVLHARGQINLEHDIESAIVADKCEGHIYLEEDQDKGDHNEHAHKDTTISYTLTIQGIGFASWLKNLVEMRELEQQKASSHQSIRAKRDETRRKLQAKKLSFEAKFSKKDAPTLEYNSSPISEIIHFINE